MADPFLGEIRLASFAAAPRGWALCNGQLLSINQNQALFSILGTTYGGDGRVNFALPDLRARMPLHFGASMPIGQRGGEAAHTLTASEIPAHTHALMASSDVATGALPANATPAVKGRGGKDMYAPGGSPPVALHPSAISSTAAAAPHDNMQPYLTVSFIIALQGIFPSRD
ncbi:phage tail protein [Ideonella sp. A 288]|uniref:phage tail protein n=1 Tax=Ideonella sp. A 288 TaxID=1962181 RepID=UPI000B4ACCC1|nr:tail fiber protein [Ideonella sp. A 288]